MTRHPRWLVFASFLGAALLFGASGAPADPASDGTDSPPTRAAQRGRLPNFYRQVVTEEQREQIYAIQAKYREQLRRLQEQIDALRQQELEEIDALLTDEQKAQIQSLQEESRQRRGSDRDAGSSDSGASQPAPGGRRRGP